MIDNDMVQSKDNKPPKGSIWKEIDKKDLVFVVRGTIDDWSFDNNDLSLSYPISTLVPFEWLKRIYNPIFLTLGTEVNVPLRYYRYEKTTDGDYVRCFCGLPVRPSPIDPARPINNTFRIPATITVEKTLTYGDFLSVEDDTYRIPPSISDIEEDKKRAKRDIIRHFETRISERSPRGYEKIRIPVSYLDILGSDWIAQITKVFSDRGFKISVDRQQNEDRYGVEITVYGFSWGNPNSYLSNKKARSRKPTVCSKKTWSQRITDWLVGEDCAR